MNKGVLSLTSKEQLFGKDKNIEENKMLKRKWQLHNESSLHKVESKFRQLNMMYTHVKQSDIDLKHS